MKAFMHHKLQAMQKLISEKLETEWVIFVSDLLVALLSLYVTLRLLLGKDFQTLQMTFILKHCLVFSLISFALFSWMRSSQGSPKYINMEKISTFVGCAVLANLFYHPLMLLMGSLPPLTPLLNTLVFVIGLLLPRFLAPIWKKHEEIKTNTVDLSPKIPVAIIGYNGQIGSYLQEKDRDASKRSTLPYHFIGILLNQPLSSNDIPPPFPVLGMVHDFVSIMQKLSLEGREPKRLLVVQESLNYLPLRQILLKFQGRGTLSLLFEMSPTSHEVTLRPLRLEDILGKVTLDYPQNTLTHATSSHTWQEVRTFIDSACVLIMGIQDLVIGQLAHHIARFYPKYLMLMDPSERALAALKVKLDQLYPDITCNYILASITDHDFLDHLVKIHKPQVIFHGERVTYPGLMACNLKQTIQKNILSPIRFAKTLYKTDVRAFVLVNAQASTPLSQIITTLISQKLQELDQIATVKYPTRFLVINNSDVWNNLDSTTAFWPQQLREGLKINMSSPDAYSYLLSADEAARTILQAIGKIVVGKNNKGQSFYLSGGEPSRFLDLLRSLSFLNGLIPEIDVKVNFFGNQDDVPSLEETNIVHHLVPGVVIDAKYSFPSVDKGFLLRLKKLVESGQLEQIVTLLETFVKGNTGKSLPLKLTG